MQRLNPLTGTDTNPLPSKYSKDEWRIVECRETGMVYLQNPPNYEDLVDDFAWEKTYAAEKERRQKEEPIFSKLSDVSKNTRKLFTKVKKMERLPVDYIRSLPEEDRPKDKLVMLDVGCGIAEISLTIAAQLRDGLGIDVLPVGVEISREQAKIADERMRDFGGGYCIQDSAIGGLRSVDDQSADVIILCSFLEHEVQPLELLQECRKKLKPNGAVIVKVPNFGCMNRKIRQKKWCGFRYPDHVNYFTPKTLRGVVEKSGLKIGRMSFMDQFPFSDNMYIIGRP